METLKKRYILKGLDCANCAEKIRSRTETVDFVRSAQMNFVVQELIVEAQCKEDVLTERVKEIVKTIEPDVEVCEKENGKSSKNEKRSYKGNVMKIIVAAVFFVIGLVIHLALDPEPSFSVEFIVMVSSFAVSYLAVGVEVVIASIKNIAKGDVFDENFLMLVASIGAIAIGEYPEAVAVMLLYQIGELFQTIAVNNSRKSITDLMDIRSDYANLKTESGVAKVDADKVKIGDVIVVKAGEKIPLDSVILKGSSSVNTSALTGESAPVDVAENDKVLSGSVNISGLLELRVEKTFENSAASKILDMVQNAASKKAQAENFITKFAKIYTPIVVIAAVLIACIPTIFFGAELSEWIKRGLLFLVISCPCALVISVPLSYFSGIGKASRLGVLVKGSNYFEALGKAKAVIFDKTGTLTMGDFRVKSVVARTDSGRLLEYAAYAEYYSTHPIGRSIVSAYKNEIDLSRISEYKELAGEGIFVKIDGKSVLAGNMRLMKRFGIEGHETSETNVQIAIDGRFAGYITIFDTVKNTSRKTIQELRERGAQRIVMLTGDNESKAKAVANELEITEYYSQLLPENKVEMVEKIKSELSDKEKLVFVGDGINDAPVLAVSDIGIAMGAFGSDAAVEAADIVLMNDEPIQIVSALNVAKRTRRIVIQNIVFALVVKLAVQALGLLGFATMWEAVFADVGVCILAILNSLRILRK